MSIDVFTLHCAASAAARLVGFKGTESLCRPFEIEVYFTLPTGTDVRSLIGAATSIEASRGEEQGAMWWHGVFVHVRLLHHTGERNLYRGLLVPRVWRLRHSVRSHVFTDRKIDAFFTSTLELAALGAGSDFRLSIDTGSYPEEEFVCQYRESHLDFVNRWCEREGLYYYFEHPEGAEAKEVMVFADDKGVHQPLLGRGAVRYHPVVDSQGSLPNSLREITVDVQELPATVLVNDYNYANPSLQIEGSGRVSAEGRGIIREYGYRVFDGGEATRLATVRAQSIAARAFVLHGVGDAFGIRAGYVFEIEDGPSDLPTRYLAIEVRHAGTLGASTREIERFTGLRANETYRVEVVAIPADVQYRAPQTTPWPRIYGFENGTVDGPATSIYAQIDDQGRYLVRFMFDHSELADGSTSTYLRMMQPHGGSNEGIHFPLRKGTEVMITYQGGDPDRPVIAGVAHNAQRPSQVTSSNHTHNVIRTGGGNYIDLEDADGSQYIDIYCPTDDTNIFMGGPFDREYQVPAQAASGPSTATNVSTSLYEYTMGNAGLKVDGATYITVGGEFNVHATGQVGVHYAAQFTQNIDGPAYEFYNNRRDTTVTQRFTHTVNGGITETVAQGISQTVSSGGFWQDITPQGSSTVHGNWTHAVRGINTDFYHQWVTHVEGAWNADIGGVAHVSSVGAMTLTAPSNNMTITAGRNIEMTAGPNIHIEADLVKIKSRSEWKDFYLSKKAIGLFKFDLTTLSTAINGIKGEKTRVSLGRTNIKLDSVAVKMDHGNVAMRFGSLDVEIKSGANPVAAALHVCQRGFTKL